MSVRTLYTIPEAAEALQKSVKEIQELILSGKLPAEFVGCTWIIRIEDLKKIGDVIELMDEDEQLEGVNEEFHQREK